MHNLEQWGWREFFSRQIKDEEAATLIPARVVEEHSNLHRVMSNQGEILVETSQKIVRSAKARAEFPVIGDWVLVQLMQGGRGILQKVLDRSTKFSRKAAGDRNEEQVIAANIDVAFVVSSLNQDLNLARLERYLTIVSQSGAKPVLLLTKADLCSNPSALINQVREVAPSVPTHILNPRAGIGLENLAKDLTVGMTGALIGSSGVGKSTLVNKLVGQNLQVVQEIRTDDDKGRHTTTFRRLVQVPQFGGMIIDTPGMREIQIWEGDCGLAETFTDIESLAVNCRFTNCRHDTEPSCAVKSGVEAGQIDKRRYNNFIKLQREAANQPKTYEKKDRGPNRKNKND